MATPRSVAVVAAAAVLALAGCGDDGPAAGTPTAPTTAADEATGDTESTSETSDTASTEAPITTGAPTTTLDLATALDGRTFVSTAVEGYQLVEGTQVQLTFDGSNLGATAGCNQMSSGYALEGDVLVVDATAMTQMACIPASLMDQDTWLSALLTSRPTVALDGDMLTLTSDGTVVTLQDREVANPDVPLEGTTWNVEGLISGDAVSTVPAGGRVPSLVLVDGSVSVDTGCNRGTGGYELGEGEITFGPLATTRAACTDPGAAEAERIVLATLAGTATYDIEADVLTLQTGSEGLMLRAAGDAGAAAAADLEGVTWTLDSIVDANTTTAVPALDRTPTLTFDGATVSVDTGCNTGSGSYEVSGDEITFGAITSTLIACTEPTASVEQAVVAMLAGPVTFSIADDVLTLTMGDQGLMYVAG
jgi:heat shock protein HslJ